MVCGAQGLIADGGSGRRADESLTDDLRYAPGRMEGGNLGLAARILLTRAMCEPKSCDQQKKLWSETEMRGRNLLKKLEF